MAWFKPAPTKDHPGEPPPKWAPIGRARRLVLVVPVIAAIVIAFTVVAARTAGATDDTDAATVSPDPLPPSWIGGQRVEVPVAGFAMTFPGDWVVELAEEGSDFPLLILAPPDRFGPEVDLQRPLVVNTPNLHEREDFSLCTLVRYCPIDLTADEFLKEIFEEWDPAVIESLDDGLSWVLADPWLSGRILTDIPEAIYIDHYAIESDDAVSILLCTGMASHRDDWVSIAVSFEALPGS